MLEISVLVSTAVVLKVSSLPLKTQIILVVGLGLGSVSLEQKTSTEAHSLHYYPGKAEGWPAWNSSPFLQLQQSLPPPISLGLRQGLIMNEKPIHIARKESLWLWQNGSREECLFPGNVAKKVKVTGGGNSGNTTMFLDCLAMLRQGFLATLYGCCTLSCFLEEFGVAASGLTYGQAGP